MSRSSPCSSSKSCTALRLRDDWPCWLEELNFTSIPLWHKMTSIALKDSSWTTLHYVSTASNLDIPSLCGGVSACSCGITRERILGEVQICARGLFDMQWGDLLPHTVYLRSLVVTFVYFLFTLWKWSMKTVGRLSVQKDFFFFFFVQGRLWACGCVCSKNWKRSEWSWLSITEPWIAAWCLYVTAYISDFWLNNWRVLLFFITWVGEKIWRLSC